MSGKIERLRELIAIELDSCSKEDWPYVCSITSTPEGKKNMEERIIEYCSTQGCTVGQALDKIESAYNPNRPED